MKKLFSVLFFFMTLNAYAWPQIAPNMMVEIKNGNYIVAQFELPTNATGEQKQTTSIDYVKDIRLDTKNLENKYKAIVGQIEEGILISYTLNMITVTKQEMYQVGQKSTGSSVLQGMIPAYDTNTMSVSFQRIAPRTKTLVGKINGFDVYIYSK